MAEASSQPTPCFSEDLSNELQALRSIFTVEGEISVEDLGPGGDYCCVVQLKPKDIDVGLQFFIPGAYPKAIPKLEILPEEGETCDLSDDPGLTQLLEVMYRSAKDSVGEPMMYSLLDVAKNWLEEYSSGEGQGGDLKEASVTDDVNESQMIPDDKKAVDEKEGEYQKKDKKKKKESGDTSKAKKGKEVKDKDKDKGKKPGKPDKKDSKMKRSESQLSEDEERQTPPPPLTVHLQVDLHRWLTARDSIPKPKEVQKPPEEDGGKSEAGGQT